ncbi:MAG TPA: phosphomannomutase/phosphoglucomutase, partial [Gammaproteobacteria bacterium]|nr:phosphomannomutase/phosphoglucomutase [Gammaproteobacteria bacterium]
MSYTQPPSDIDPNIFREYDIRGVAGDNLSVETVYWIARAFATQCISQNIHKCAIGGDGRISTPAIRNSLSQGLSEGGLNVVDIGTVPTPLLYYATHRIETGTGIMITGSHNPPEYNGLKMV